MKRSKFLAAATLVFAAVGSFAVVLPASAAPVRHHKHHRHHPHHHHHIVHHVR